MNLVCKSVVHKHCATQNPLRCVKQVQEEVSKVVLSNPDKEGYLLKQGKINTALKKRWFVLKANHLHYFASPEDVEKVKLESKSSTFFLFFGKNR